LDIILQLGSQDWQPDTLIRQASVAVGLNSKGLERHQRTFESGLARQFGTATPLKSLGFVGDESHVELRGPVLNTVEAGNRQPGYGRREARRLSDGLRRDATATFRRIRRTDTAEM